MTITNLKARLPVQTADAALHPYKDATEASDWAISSIADCLQGGIVLGRSSRIAPKDYITKAEVAAMVERLLQKSDLI